MNYRKSKARYTAITNKIDEKNWKVLGGQNNGLAWVVVMRHNDAESSSYRVDRYDGPMRCSKSLQRRRSAGNFDRICGSNTPTWIKCPSTRCKCAIFELWRVVWSLSRWFEVAQLSPHFTLSDAIEQHGKCWTSSALSSSKNTLRNNLLNSELFSMSRWVHGIREWKVKGVTSPTDNESARFRDP